MKLRARIKNTHLGILLSSKTLLARSIRKAIARQTNGYNMEAGVFGGRGNQERQDLSDFQETSRPW
jgi:hypothetical protein